MAVGDTSLHGQLAPLFDMPEPVGGDLVVAADGLVSLTGSKCRDCGECAFPARLVCMTCGSRKLDAEEMPRSGHLYTFSTVHVSSSRPVPYSIGYVDLENGVRVLAQVDPAARIGERVGLVVSNGCFQFVPVAGA